MYNPNVIKVNTYNAIDQSTNNNGTVFNILQFIIIITTTRTYTIAT